MGKVLTKASVVKCIHQGKVSLTESQSVLKVNGHPVLVGQLQGSIAASPAPNGCTQIPPPQSNKPCTMITAQGSGFSSVLKVNGLPVLLEDSSGLTDGTPTNGWSVQDAGQQVLQAS